jgi:hypothetical protein
MRPKRVMDLRDLRQGAFKRSFKESEAYIRIFQAKMEGRRWDHDPIPWFCSSPSISVN